MKHPPKTVLTMVVLAGLLGACSEAPGEEWMEGFGERAPAFAAPAAANHAAPVGTSQAGSTVVAAATPDPTPATPRQTFETECGACHMPFPPQLLPVRSWQAIMSGLDDHFKEDASLDPDTATVITTYLAADAADAGGRRSGALRGLRPGDVPLRITDTPWWRAVHSEISPRRFARADIKTKANCLACHRNGGSAEEDE